MPSKSATHIPALDGVRGLAILAVLLCHAWWGYLKHGSLGVDLFFVLSGFLITGILLNTYGRDGYLRVFFARRSLRLFPLAFVYLAIVAFAVPHVHSLFHTSMADYHGSWWWYITYLSNWKDGVGRHDPYLGHFWSLAVEEQFYLVWPFVILACRGRLKPLAITCCVIMVGSLALRFGLLGAGIEWRTLYGNTLTRIDAIAAGALVVVAMRANVAVPRWPLLLFPSIFLPLPWERTISQTVAAVVFATVVSVAATRPPTWLSHPALVSLGKYSYCLYLIHMLALEHTVWLMDALIKRGAPSWIQHVGIIHAYAACYGVAVLSARYFESPIRRFAPGYQSRSERKPVKQQANEQAQLPSRSCSPPLLSRWTAR